MLSTLGLGASPPPRSWLSRAPPPTSALSFGDWQRLLGMTSPTLCRRGRRALLGGIPSGLSLSCQRSRLDSGQTVPLGLDAPCSPGGGSALARGPHGRTLPRSPSAFASRRREGTSLCVRMRVGVRSCVHVYVSVWVLGFLDTMHPSSSHFSADAEGARALGGGCPTCGAPHDGTLLVVTQLTHPHIGAIFLGSSTADSRPVSGALSGAPDPGPGPLAPK